MKTLFGFYGYEGGDWDLEMDLPRSSMMPDPDAVATLTVQQRQVCDFQDTCTFTVPLL